jgi:hypothetical protein
MREKKLKQQIEAGEQAGTPRTELRKRPRPRTERLKAERIQLKSVRNVGTPLKAERIQLKAERIQQRLAELPGWMVSPRGGALSRTYRLPAPGAAAAHAAYAAVLAQSSGLALGLGLRGDRLSLTVRDRAAVRGGITETVLSFAEKLG